MKAILFIMDGVGDRPLKELNYKTPLQVAKKPSLDKIAEGGECGIMDPVAPGIRCGSDTSHLAILGYDPYKTYTGRGPFEAMGIGMELQGGDVSFRCNFATVDENFIVLDRRAGRIEEGTIELIKDLNGIEIDRVKCFLKESTAHRCALVLRGENLGHNVSDIDPHKENLKIHSAEGGDKKSEKTAEVLNKLVRKSYEILNAHPVNIERKNKGLLSANIILPRGAGVAPHLEKFQDKYKLSAACCVEVGLIKGIGKYLGMDIIEVVGSTGGYDTDVIAIVKKVVESLKKYDFVLCNIKGCDVAGHDGDYKMKINIIEKINQGVEYILNSISDKVLIILTSDHSTPVSCKDHSGDAVPIVFWGKGVRVDKVKCFDEISCAEGGLGRIKGYDVMNILTNLLNVQEKFGA